MTKTAATAVGIASSVVSEGSVVTAVTIDDERADAGEVRGHIETKGGKRHAVRFVPVRGSLGIAGVARIKAEADPGSRAPVIVLVERVGPEVRRALLANGLGYIDAAGNCHLELDRGRIIVQIGGRRADQSSPTSAALHDAGYRVLFAVLAEPDLLDRPVREIEKLANASRHSVSVLLARLRDEGVVVRAGRSRHVFTPGGKETCIDRFTTGWADVLRGRLLVGRYRTRERDPEAVEDTVLRAFEARQVPFGFGGSAGAARVTRYLRSQETTIHTPGWSSTVQEQLGAAPDREGPLVVFRTMGSLDLDTRVPCLAHPLLIRAELARSPEPRSREAAALVLEKVLEDR